MNGDGSGAAPSTRSPPSNEYCMASDAVITKRPVPLNVSLAPAVSTPARWVRPVMNAPPKQQSRNRAIFSERQRVISLLTQLASIAVDMQPVDPRVGRGEVQLAVVVLQPVAREMDEQQLVACPVGEERVERRPELCQRRVQGELDVEPADLGVAEDRLERLGVAAGAAQRREASILVLAGGDDEGAALLGHYAIPGSGAAGGA